jgi:hypothetical protein
MEELAMHDEILTIDGNVESCSIHSCALIGLAHIPFDDILDDAVQKSRRRWTAQEVISYP